MSLSCKLALSIGIGTVPLTDELFASLREANIEAIELSAGKDLYKDFDFAGVAGLAAAYNITLWSLHLPFVPFHEIDISRPDLSAHTVALFEGYIKKASEVGIKTFVVHPSGEPIEEADRSARLACAKESLRQLADFAAELGCVIAVEDLPRTCLGRDSGDMLSLLSADKRLRVCFDTNHLLQEDNVDFIREVGDRIVTTHISDYDYINERHWLPGEGKTDWTALTAALEQAGYDGYWLYEVGFDTPWSIDRPRKLTCMDFKRNFDELMAGKAPTPTGTPKQNLGMWRVNE